MSAGEQCLDELLLALQRLDRLLEKALATAQTVYGPEASADRFRGLHISQNEVERLLNRNPGTPILHMQGEEPEEPLPDYFGDDSRLAWLQRAFNMSLFEVNLIMIAIAPELDLRYERLYAYLQDDVTRKRPSVDLALNLLCPSAEAKLAQRGCFAPDAPLIRHDLLHLIPDPNQVQPPLLAHYFKLDEQIVRLLLGQESLDSRLAPLASQSESSGYHTRWP